MTKACIVTSPSYSRNLAVANRSRLSGSSKTEAAVREIVFKMFALGKVHQSNSASSPQPDGKWLSVKVRWRSLTGE